MAKVIEITNPLTGQPQQVIQSDYTAQQIDDAVAAVQPFLPGGPGLPVNQGGTGADTAQLALANLGGRPNPNLLDNWYFVGGGSQKGYGIFPINQQGKTNYTSQQTSPSTIDRWRAAWNVTLDVTDDGLVMSGGGVFQYLSNEIINHISGKIITISALYSDGNLATQTGNADSDFGDDAILYKVAYGGRKNAIRFVGAIAAVKLEVGDKQTLCYQDSSGIWQLLEAPDYGTELARCKRYLRSFNAWTKFEADYIDSNRIMFSIPGDMRTDPAVSGFGLYRGVQLQSGFTFEAHRNGNNIVVVANKNGHGLTSAWLGVSDKAYLTAEL